MHKLGYSELQYARDLGTEIFGKSLCQYSTERPERNSTDGVEVKQGECLVPLDPFSLVRIEIYKPFYIKMC